MPNVLVHSCCGPCLAYVVEDIGPEEVFAYFSNPNIMPYMEWVRRRDGFVKMANALGVEYDVDSEYPLHLTIKDMVHAMDSKERCAVCYEMRMVNSARKAMQLDIERLTTTLLYSKYQEHELVRHIGESVADDFGIEFLYRDFRKGWGRHREAAMEHEVYLQSYCGCIYSEFERYGKDK